MDKKRLEEIKVMTEKAKKNLAEELKTVRKEQAQLGRVLLVMKALDELLEENADFKRQFESKLKELSLKEEAAKQGEP